MAITPVDGDNNKCTLVRWGPLRLRNGLETGISTKYRDTSYIGVVVMLMHFVFFLQQLKEDVALLDPQIDEFLRSSDSLLDDSDLPDEDRRIVERESDLLEKRWNNVKNDANSREPRFVNTMK